MVLHPFKSTDMASPFEPSSTPPRFTVANVINQARARFSELPDIRKTATANNLKYTVGDAVLSAFSVFFSQSPSFLDYQVRLQKKYGKNNAQSPERENERNEETKIKTPAEIN